MADPLSAVASIVGIVGFGIQLAKVLQKQVEETSTATERVEQIVIEIRATATGLTNVKEFLIEDGKDPYDMIFNDEGRDEVDHIVKHSNTVFRNVTVLVAKAGNGVLSQIDLYQRKVEDSHRKRRITKEPEVTLEIDLSNLEHLMWPWRLPKIQQYLADLDRLKLSLVLILSVANLAKTRKQKAMKAISDGQSEHWEGSDAETLVQDEIYYQDRGLQEAEKKFESLALGPLVVPDTLTRSKQNAAQLVLQSWPYSPSGNGLCSVADLHDAGIVLESYAFAVGEKYDTKIDLPFNLQAIQQQALRGRKWTGKTPRNVWDEFARLPVKRQEYVTDFLRQERRAFCSNHFHEGSPYSHHILISLHFEKLRWIRFLDFWKRCVTFDGSGPSRKPTLNLTTARMSLHSASDNIEGMTYNPSGPVPVRSGYYSYSDGTDSDSSGDNPRRIFERRRRRRYSRSRSRSSSIPDRRSRVGRLARRLARGVRSAREKEIIREEIIEERRSRSPSRRVSRYSDDDDYSRDKYDERSRRGTDGMVEYGDRPPHTVYEPRPPRRADTAKTGNNADGTMQIRRFETINERNNQKAPSPEPDATAGKTEEKAQSSEEPIVELPASRRRTTTFKSDMMENDGPRKGPPALGMTAATLAINYLRSRKTDPDEKPRITVSRRDTDLSNKSIPKSRSRYLAFVPRRRRGRINSTAASSEDSGSDRRTRSRSRLRERYIQPFSSRNQRPTDRSDYSDMPVHRYREHRRTRRSAVQPSSMPLLISSPPRPIPPPRPAVPTRPIDVPRPIVRTFKDDGIPPTQRDKAAVAEYYLKKWTVWGMRIWGMKRRGRMWRSSENDRNPFTDYEACEGPTDIVMPPLDVQPRALRSPAAVLRAAFATSRPRKPLGPRNTLGRPPPLRRRTPEPHRSSSQSNQPAQEKQSSIDAVSSSLKETNAEDNNLLAPVNIPEDPDGVLNEKHPAARLLSYSSLVVTRQLEMMNVMLGFEQANRYVIMDPHGNHVGYMAERDLGMGNMLARQAFTTHRSFTTHVFDKHEKEVLRFHRPFSWISSRIGVYDPLEAASVSHSASTTLQDPKAGGLSTDVNSSTQVSPLAISDMRIVGEAQQQWAPLRRKYNLFLFRKPPTAETDLGTRQIASGDLLLSNSQQLQVARTDSESGRKEGEYGQFAYVDEPFLSWDFSLLSANNRLVGSVNRNWAGFGREIFTDTGVYMLRMDAAGLANEPRHLISKTGETSETTYDSPKVSGLTLDQRAVMLATAVSVDFDYFSRKSGSGGFMPMWMPWWGGGAAEAGGEAGAAGAAGAAGEAGVGEAAGGAVGGAARGAGGMGEGAAVGAGSMAGYEAMQRGAYGQRGDDASPTAGDSGDFGTGPTPPNETSGQSGSEDVWGKDDDPWGGSGGGGAADGGGGGSWADTLGGFFEE